MIGYTKRRRSAYLSVADKLSITLKYYREYRLADYAVNKSAVREIIQWIEETLSGNKAFKTGTLREIQRIVVYVTGRPIERPENKKSIIQGKRNVYHKDAGNNQAEKPADSKHKRQRPQFQA